MGNRGTTPSWDDEQIAKYGVLEHLGFVGRYLRADMRREKQLGLIRQYRSALRCWGYSAEPLPNGEIPSHHDGHKLSERHLLTILDQAEARLMKNDEKVGLYWIHLVQNKLFELGWLSALDMSRHQHFT